MNHRIFISYRRDDSFVVAERICTALQQEIGAGAVFMDKTIEPGEAWPDRIRNALKAAATVLVIVHDWATWLAVGTLGKRRIDDPQDWVRQEVRAALTQKKTIIPVLYEECNGPIEKDDLPDDISQMCDMQRTRLSRDHWDRDLKDLVEKLAFTTPPADLATRCDAALRDYAGLCIDDWKCLKPTRFIEPHVAIRNDAIRDRSQTPTDIESPLALTPLLTDTEKMQSGDVVAAQQYLRLLQRRPKRSVDTARLCITEDAGAGKSIFTHHLRYILASDQGRELVFNGQPPLVVRWEGRARSWPFDLQLAMEQEVDPFCTAHGVTPRQVVDHAVRQQAVCLIFDGLDQGTHDFNSAGQRIERLELLDRIFGFLQNGTGRQCHVVITGRSYAVTQDADGDHFPVDAWTFATLEGFSQYQQERYLSDFLTDRTLQELIPCYPQVAELLAVPVILNLIADIADSGSGARKAIRLHQFRTRGDLYREAHERLASRAGKTGIKPTATARAHWEALLSAAAFVMMCDENQRRNYAVPGMQAVTKFRTATAKWARRLDGTALVLSDKDWEDITEFSQLTHHASVETCSRSMVSWKHRGWMEYFAGLYLARYAPRDAAAASAPFSNDPDWYWTWRFAIEMPAEIAEADVRGQSLACLFERPAAGRRPTELIYRAWDVMQDSQIGSQSIRNFLQEYPDLLAAGKPIALQIETGFLPCPPDPARDSLTFKMGFSPEEIEVTVPPFLMHKNPVTVAQFQEFDEGYAEAEQEFLVHFSPQTDCPAIRISWYDAWCFSIWCGCRLPREYEWEFACRAGTTSDYWWGDHDDPSKRTFATSGTTPASASHANGWGLMELAGNVWEWCEDWYHHDRRSTVDQGFTGERRVLRGGSFFINIPEFLRCANRYNNSPVNRLDSSGFRISRTK